MRGDVAGDSKDVESVSAGRVGDADFEFESPTSEGNGIAALCNGDVGAEDERGDVGRDPMVRELGLC